MMRGTFANIRIRIRNEMVLDIEGGYIRHIPSGEAFAIIAGKRIRFRL